LASSLWFWLYNAQTRFCRKSKPLHACKKPGGGGIYRAVGPGLQAATPERSLHYQQPSAWLISSMHEKSFHLALHVQSSPTGGTWRRASCQAEGPRLDMGLIDQPPDFAASGRRATTLTSRSALQVPMPHFCLVRTCWTGTRR
jgi:hypothetical protein